MSKGTIYVFRAEGTQERRKGETSRRRGLTLCRPTDRLSEAAALETGIWSSNTSLAGKKRFCTSGKKGKKLPQQTACSRSRNSAMEVNLRESGERYWDGHIRSAGLAFGADGLMVSSSSVTLWCQFCKSPAAEASSTSSGRDRDYEEVLVFLVILQTGNQLCPLGHYISRS